MLQINVTLSFLFFSLIRLKLSVNDDFSSFLPDSDDFTRARERREERSRHGPMTTASACCQRNNIGRNERGGRRVEPGECFPGLIKIRNDLFPGSAIPPLHRFSHADTASSGTRFLFPSRDLDSDLDPHLATESITCSFQITARQQLLFPFPAFPPSRLPFVFDAPIAKPWIGQSYLLAVSGSVTTPHYCATNRFSTLLVFLLSIHPFCPFFLFRCSAISRLYLLTDSFAITRPWHSYRLFQSSCPNVGSMTSACTGQLLGWLIAIYCYRLTTHMDEYFCSQIYFDVPAARVSFKSTDT